MAITTTEIDVIELKRLLFELKDVRRDIGVRLRLLGEMWQPRYCKVLTITEVGAALIEEKTNKLIFVQELSSVMQFEIDKPYQHFKPHYHYHVKVF